MRLSTFLISLLPLIALTTASPVPNPIPNCLAINESYSCQSSTEWILKGICGQASITGTCPTGQVCSATGLAESIPCVDGTDKATTTTTVTTKVASVTPTATPPPYLFFYRYSCRCIQCCPEASYPLVKGSSCDSTCGEGHC